MLTVHTKVLGVECPCVSYIQLPAYHHHNHPTRQWTEDEEEWVQCVSSKPGTRMDVITLQVP